ncbi:tail assembly chaperone [Mycobacterium phage Phlei]|uniref:Tail assembly chaperone n=1 Tax=Mycobacterium phage Phlei TaxID=1690684 RepID=A0A0N7E4H3_9CAUD|nr:tail assembly chaperone [Mycobacterium phage Phlei]ALA48133.1 hypothetical protein [Mycobacterium phage Phlei]
MTYNNTFSLDDIRAEVERRFAPTIIELSDDSTVELKPLIRLGQKDREAVLNYINEMSELTDGDDDELENDDWAEIVCDVAEKVLKLVANSPRKLLEALDHDDIEVKASMYSAVLSRWIGDTQLGGSRVLAELIDKYGEAILCDLLQYYRVDIRDLFREEDPLSPRYVLALVLNLPKDGAFHAARRGSREYRGWDEDRYALVALVNEMKANNHLFTLAHSDPKKRKPKPPEPFPTPDTETKPQAPKPGSFAGMLIAAKKAARQRREAND